MIYCIYNFQGNPIDFAYKVAVRKSATPKDPLRDSIASQLAVQAKPRMMALNIPTHVNLVGYGYQNVYELDEFVDVNDPRIEFKGTIVNK